MICRGGRVLLDIPIRLDTGNEAIDTIVRDKLSGNQPACNAAATGR